MGTMKVIQTVDLDEMLQEILERGAEVGRKAEKLAAAEGYETAETTQLPELNDDRVLTNLRTALRDKVATASRGSTQTLPDISPDTLERVLGLREANLERSGLDPRTSSLVKIAVLIALDAPPASYAWQVADALETGVTPEDILGVLRAVAPQVGGPKVVAAAPEIMLALGLDLETEQVAEPGQATTRRSPK
jgi:4-carboxymuconolactone decarboxylase